MFSKILTTTLSGLCRMLYAFNLTYSTIEWCSDKIILFRIMWKLSDIQLRVVTHTRNPGSAFLPIQSAHTQQWTHTHTRWTHTRSSGQPFMLQRPGSSWVFGALLKGISVMVLRVESAGHSLPHLQFLPAQESNSQPLDYESDSLIIRPQLSRLWPTKMRHPCSTLFPVWLMY